MKLTLHLIATGFLFASITLNAQKVTPGISAAEFKTKVPGIIPDVTTYNESISREEKMGHFNGSWYFDFRNDTLQNATYSLNLGMKPLPGSVSTYLKYFNSFSKDMDKPVRSVTSRDTVLRGDRKRVENTDTVVCSMWRNKHTMLVMGIYFTGNYKIKKDPSDMVSQNMINAAPAYEYYTFTIRCLPLNDKNAPDAWKFYPGLHVNDFVKIFPDLFPDGLGVNGQYGTEELKMGLKGKRSYTFKAGKLDWTLWDYYAGKCDEVTYNNLKRSANAIVAEYTKVYGTPTSMKNDLKFNKSAKFSPVEGELLATWDKGIFTVEISYRALSGKGMCDLLIKVEEKVK